LSTNYIETHIIRERNGELEFLLLKRASYQWFPDLWQMVSGKVKDNEKAYQSAIREVLEETGLRPNRLWVIPNVSTFYLAEDDSINFVPVFLVQVDFDSIVKLSSEHSDFKWVSFEQAKKLLAWPGQRRSIEIINEIFNQNEKSTLHLDEINLSEI
jgi:dATP pyrophosphohydrolase